MEIVQSKRGKDKLMHDGYMYVFERLSADHTKKFWRCVLKGECKARLHTTASNNGILTQMNEHSHGSDASQLHTAMIMNEIKQRAKETTEVPSVILNDALQGTSADIQAKMPNKDAIRKVIQRSRNLTLAALPQPADRASIIIPDAHRSAQKMSYKQQQHLRSLLTDAIVELCRRESFYVEELRIEGTICIVSDRSSVVIAQITEQVGEKFSDAEPDNGGIAFEDDNTVPFKSRESNAEDDARSNLSCEDEGDEDYKDNLGEGSSGAQHDSVMPCLESNHLDDAAVNAGLDVAEQLASIMSIYNQMPKAETNDSPARRLSPFSRHSSAAQSEGFNPADAFVGFDENISLERSANGKFQCPYCVKSYGFKHTLKEHLNKHLGKRPHVCKHCGDSFTHLASLCAHVKRRHDDLMPQDFKCVICQEKLMNFQSLKQHYTWRHKNVKFPDDKVVDQDAVNVDSSLAIKDGDVPVELDSKPKRRKRSQRRTFVKPETDEFVVGDTFGDGQKRIKVELPDEVNNALPLDSSALLEAFERKDYESIQEGFAASFLDNLGLDGGSEERFQDDGTDSAAGLGFQKMDGASDVFQHAKMIARYFDEIHIETEQGLYRYRCKVCSNMFKIRNSLYEHLNSHLGKKPHQCSYCGDSFAHHSSLHNHVRNKHSFQTSAEKQASFKHFCLGCDRKFRYRSELERHLKCNPDHAMGGLPVE